MARRITTGDLRFIAAKLPDVEEGIACAGTSIERRTMKVRGKAFLFLGATDAKFKLQDALKEASQFAEDHPDSCRVGSSGWVDLTFGDDRTTPPTSVLKRWIAESHSLFAGSTKRSKS